jgi:Rubisco Assembly chaperone C-terminal domain
MVATQHHTEENTIMTSLRRMVRFVAVLMPLLLPTTSAYSIPSRRSTQLSLSASSDVPLITTTGNLHGSNACFLPLQQLEQDTYTPRIVYIAGGTYPHDLTAEQVLATPRAPPAPPLGQWTYTFADEEDEAAATVALEGSNLVASCGDPIIIIAEHESLGVALPSAIREPVDLLVLVDREKPYFSERKFLVLSMPNDSLSIAAYHTREAIPAGATILGQVDQVTIPWLPSMAPTKTGFLEADEYY